MTVGKKRVSAFIMEARAFNPVQCTYHYFIRYKDFQSYLSQLNQTFASIIKVIDG